ncbi:MAG: hypothetical protein MK188_01800 [Gammaproteobacteria bacterium]|nr:hypothetical protein [Gammaproteobacteria bacterium]
MKRYSETLGKTIERKNESNVDSLTTKVGDGTASGNVVGTLTYRGIPIQVSGTRLATRSGAVKRGPDNGLHTLIRLTNEAM